MPRTDAALSEKLISGGWTKIKEPRTLSRAIFSSIPFMILALTMSYFTVYPFYDLQASVKELISHGFSFTVSLPDILAGLILIYLFIVAHEFLHMVMIPNFHRSEKTCWGLSLQGGFVFTTEQLRKGSFYLISIFPYFVLSFILPIVLGLCGKLNGFLIFLIVVNALGSSVDFLNISLIAKQVPNKSKIINNGFETFYK